MPTTTPVPPTPATGTPRFEEITRYQRGWAFTASFPRGGPRLRFRTDDRGRGLFLMLAPALSPGHEYPLVSPPIPWERVAWCPPTYRWPVARHALDTALADVFRRCHGDDRPSVRGGQRGDAAR